MHPPPWGRAGVGAANQPRQRPYPKRIVKNLFKIPLIRTNLNCCAGLSPPPQGKARSGGGLGWGWAIFSINRNSAFPIVCCPHPNPISCFASNACRCANCPSPHRNKHRSHSEREREHTGCFPCFQLPAQALRENAIPQDFEETLGWPLFLFHNPFQNTANIHHKKP